jgi:hypothetical protein
MDSPQQKADQTIPLLELGRVSEAALSVLLSRESDECDRFKVLSGGLTVQCVMCGEEFDGADLLAVVEAKCNGGATKGRARRLSLGYCARSGCSSYYCSVRFPPTSGLDWSSLEHALSRREAEERDLLEAQELADESARASWFRRTCLRVGLRAGVGVIVIVLLLMLRQWRNGGTIPLIHEPRPSMAAPASLE